jgi:hypothetical protein
VRWIDGATSGALGLYERFLGAGDPAKVNGPIYMKCLVDKARSATPPVNVAPCQTDYQRITTRQHFRLCLEIALQVDHDTLGAVNKRAPSITACRDAEGLR